MPCLVPSSASVRSPRIASSVTFALKSALYASSSSSFPSVLQIGDSLTPCPNFRDYLNSQCSRSLEHKNQNLVDSGLIGLVILGDNLQQTDNTWLTDVDTQHRYGQMGLASAMIERCQGRDQFVEAQGGATMSFVRAGSSRKLRSAGTRHIATKRRSAIHCRGGSPATRR